MSLINSMLAGLEDRQAYLSEGRNSVFEGLSPVNDDNFHKSERRSSAPIAIIIFLALVVLALVQAYRYYAGNNSGGMAVETVIAETDSQPAPQISSVTTAVKAVPSNIAGSESSQPSTIASETTLRMDYRLSGTPAAATESEAETAATVVSDLTAEKSETVVIVPVVDKTEIVTNTPLIEKFEMVASEPVAKKIVTTASEPSTSSIQKPSISAIDVDMSEGAGSTVRLMLSEKADYRVYELNKPDRVVVEFDEYLQLPEILPLQSKTGVINKIRGHHLDSRSKRTMLVFELMEAGRVQKAEFSDTMAGYELVMQIVPVNMSVQNTSTPAKVNAEDVESQTDAVVYKQKEGTVSRTINQSSPDEILSRGLGYYQKGQIRKGLDEILKALEAEPRHIQARTTLVNMLIEQNRVNEALDVLSKGIAILPDQYDWLKLKAKLLVRSNRSNDAIETLIKAGPDINLDPDYYAFLAALLQQQGRNVEAVEHYRDVVNVKSNNGVWWMGLGISLERIGEQTQAKDAYKTAITDQSLSPDIRNYVSNRLSALSGP